MDFTGPKAFNDPNDMSKDSFYNSEFKLVERVNNKDLEDVKGKLVQG